MVSRLFYRRGCEKKKLKGISCESVKKVNLVGGSGNRRAKFSCG